MKWVKRIGISLAILALLLILLNQFVPVKAAFYGEPDKRDLNRFQAQIIEKGEACFNFLLTNKTPELMVNDWTTDLPVFRPVTEILSSHSVRSCLIIRKDTILLEYYGKNYNENSLHSSYSIAKSFTSALIGIAIAEGKIGSEEDLVLKYLPDLKGDAALKKLTIKHLLNQTSGLKYKLLTDANIYYGSDISKSIEYLEFEHQPGVHQAYLNINAQLLGYIIEAACQKSFGVYLQEKIWQPLGMCNNAKWLVDQKKGMAKTYCCLGASAKDYAKFGRLYLNQGDWEGNSILPTSWIKKSLARDTTAGSSFNYNYSWHIGLKKYGDFMANGMYKQHIYVYPEKEVIIVLLNDKEEKLKEELVNWWYVFRQIADQL